MNSSKKPLETTPDLLENIATNPWDNIYWYARMLIASDKYGAVGSDSKTIVELASALKTILNKLKKEPDNTVIETLFETLRLLLFNRWKNTQKISMVRLLIQDLSHLLLTKKDFEVFIVTCEKIVVPINNALKLIPSDDKIFAESIAHALLSSRGEKGLGSVIDIWDEVGSHGCMTAERTQIVQTFSLLREWLNTQNINIIEKDIVLTAFCQEFERRTGQKRKGRAGRGVESVTSFILNYYKIKASDAPEHFTTGLEIDRWVKNKDGWFIGISCKRTLRERWKQAYTTDINLLNRHKIKALWHVITFDRDLSDDKLTEMGSYRAVFYLPDSSTRYQSALTHIGMRKYVRPLTSFVKDLKLEVGK